MIIIIIIIIIIKNPYFAERVSTNLNLFIEINNKPGKPAWAFLNVCHFSDCRIMCSQSKS